MNVNNVKSLTPQVELVRFPVHGDKRGSLIALEGGQNIPFEIRRVYYIYGVSAALPRGFHAHRKLNQILICIHGKINVHCEYGEKEEEYILDSSDKGLLIGSFVWHSMTFIDEKSVLLVIADGHYNQSDYIRDYQEFKKIEYGAH